MKYVTLNGKKVLEDIKREASDDQKFINYDHILNAFKLTDDEVFECLEQLESQDFIELNKTLKILSYKNLDAPYKIVDKQYLNTHTTNLKKLKDEYCPFIDEQIIENYPYNITQHNYLKDIQKTYNHLKDTDKKYILIESEDTQASQIITSSIAELINDTYIITHDKQKNENYKQIARFTEYKNRENFNCMEAGILDIQNNGQLKRCSEGRCLEKPDLLADEEFHCKYDVTDKQLQENPNIVCCPYINHKQKIQNTNITLINYTDALNELNNSTLPKRKLIILDDVHKAEKYLMNHIVFKISKNDLKEDLAYHMDNTKLSIPEAIDKVDEILTLYNKAYHADRKYEIKLKLMNLLKTLKKDQDNWVCIVDDKYMTFKPINIQKYAQKYLTDYADKIIMTSNNIQNRNLLLKWLNIDKNDVAFIKVNKKNTQHTRPIIMNLIGAMSKKKRNKTKPKTKPVIHDILRQYPENKGIIYTSDIELQKYIQDEIQDPRLIFNTDDENMIKTFNESSDPLIIVTSDFNYSDINYDNVSFQVVYKIPYPPLKDEQIKQRKNQEEEWYIYQAINNLCEIYMKAYENTDDITTTYILDSGIKTILDNKNYIQLIPEFIKDKIEK